MGRAMVLCLLLGGCAAMPEGQCTAYDAGRADAQFGRRPNFDAYARSCPGQSEAEYLAGWSIGSSETSFRQPN